MSKAFTRESDDSSEEVLPPRPKSPLPPGAKNYVTPTGARSMRGELEQLLALEQQRLAEAIDVSQVRRELQKARERVEYLEQSLQSAVIVPPPAPPWDQVRFGATVTVRDHSGHETRYRIVGVDEIDLERDWVSWLSPIARALTNARIGQRVRFRAPGGEQELEVLEIVYE